MTTEPTVDPLFDALSALTSLTPPASHERRVRKRCHALLARHRAKSRTRAPGISDLAVAGAVCFYVVAVVSEAVELLAALSR